MLCVSKPWKVGFSASDCWLGDRPRSGNRNKPGRSVLDQFMPNGFDRTSDVDSESAGTITLVDLPTATPVLVLRIEELFRSQCHTLRTSPVRQLSARRERSAISCCCSSASPIASICTTSSAALTAPSMATVATGMPVGICTVE